MSKRPFLTMLTSKFCLNLFIFASGLVDIFLRDFILESNSVRLVIDNSFSSVSRI